MKIYLGLGSNLGDRGANLQSALLHMEQWGIEVTNTSALYEAEPVGKIDQPWFLNMVVEVETDKSPADLLMALNSIERSLGRERKEKWGPRIIDIDILFYDQFVLNDPELTIPHPFLQERKFVLLPLASIAPNFVHPIFKKTVEQLLKECSDESIVRSQV